MVYAYGVLWFHTRQSIENPVFSSIRKRVAGLSIPSLIPHSMIMAAPATLPKTTTVRALRARNGSAAWIVLGFLTVTAAGLGLSMQSGLMYGVGQVLLAVAFVQWFCLLHEAGHGTLFSKQKWNVRAGHLAGFFALIPFHSWRLIHHEHHRWTGWQDLDPTTEALVPRELKFYERAIINTSWFIWFPLFSILYRVNNFWRFGRIKKRVQERHHRKVGGNLIVQGVLYLVLTGLIGLPLLEVIGPALLVSFMFMDVILFSQHNHIPQKLSHGERVSPHPFIEQQPFTRSLIFPQWFARGVLLNFDAHELHHMYPTVPGYRLTELNYQPPNAISFWKFVWKAKTSQAAILMFKNQRDTGWDF